MTEITRRHFFFGSAALLAVAAAPPILVREKKVRQFFVPGQPRLSLMHMIRYEPCKRAFVFRKGERVAVDIETALRPQADCDDIAAWEAAAQIRLSDGQRVAVRDFRESDKYSRIIIPSGGSSYSPALTFETKPWDQASADDQQAAWRAFMQAVLSRNVL
jgi:hypothetical protein